MSDARSFYAELGVTLPGSAITGGASVRCFANPEAHKHDDRSASCSVNLDTGQWRCFACGAKGGAFDAAVALGRSRAEAADLARQHELFPTDRSTPDQTRPRTGRSRSASSLPTEEKVAAWRRELLDHGQASARLGEVRGWTREAIERFELGIDGDRITFPIRDAVGQLVGLLRYAPNPETRKGKKKMLAAKGTPRELFPPPETLPADEPVSMHEGEPDVIAAWSMGLVAVGVPGAQGWNGHRGSPAATLC